MTHQQTETITALFQAIGAYDVDAAKALFASDASITVPDRPTYHGADGAVTMINDLASSYVDWKPQPKRIFGDGDVVAVEWTTTITDFGGSQSVLDGSSIVDIVGGKISRLRSYFRPEDTRS
ncbi:MAG TPA: nuclear transport factor 2 family protein [Armatimonadota bacterium]|jgi:ketosteroid isomerase-like protein